MDFEALKKFAELWKKTYTESTVLLDLHLVVAVLSVLAVVVLVGNVIWKITLMRSEANLVKAGKEAVV